MFQSFFLRIFILRIFPKFKKCKDFIKPKSMLFLHIIINVYFQFFQDLYISQFNLSNFNRTFFFIFGYI